MLSKLAQVANKLDSFGLTKDADFLDRLISRASSDWDDLEIGEPYTPDDPGSDDISNDKEIALTMNMDFVDVDSVDGPYVGFYDGNRIVYLDEDFFMNEPGYEAFAEAWISYCQAGSDLHAEEQAERRHFMAD